MSATIRDILNTEDKIQLLVEALESSIKKCKAIANKPMQGYSNVNHQQKVEKWTEKAEAFESLMDEILTELN